MLIFTQAALFLCAVFLLGTMISLAAAYRSGNKRQIRMLHLLRLGLILSACSYVLRILEPPRLGHVSFFSFLFCLFGTALIWLGFREQWRMQRESRDTPSAQEPESSPGTLSLAELPPGLPLLTFRAQQALRYAQEDAHCHRLPCVDTEHLLLGLLRTPQSAGVQILDCLGVSREKVHLHLLSQMASSRKFSEPSPLDTTLTEGASQVFALAAQEAYRFDETSVGTEHLLLGLALMGKGKAALVLFGEGVTVDDIRNEILKSKKPLDPTKP